jgi:hypothetical protein
MNNTTTSVADTNVDDIMNQFGIRKRPTGINEIEHIPTEIDDHPEDTQPLARQPHIRLGLILVGITGASALLYAFIAGKGNNALPLPEPVASSSAVDPRDAEIAQLKSQVELNQQKDAFGGKPVTGSSSPTPSATAQPQAATKPTATATKAKSPAVAPQQRPTTNSTVQPTVVYRPAPAVAPRVITDPAQSRLLALQSNKNAELERKIKSLELSLKKSEASAKIAKSSEKKPLVAAAPVIPQPTAPAMVSPVQAPSRTLMVGTRVNATLIDPVNASASNGGGNISTQQVSLMLSQPILGAEGWEIPAGAIVAFDTNIDSKNGFVKGQSTGVWYKGQALQVEMGALSIEGAGGMPLQAKAINTNSDDVANAQNSQAVWGAVGGGVDQMTRQDSTTTIGNGIAVATNTGGNRDFLTGALGGFAKAKVDSEKGNAKERASAAAAMTPIWNLPAGTNITVAVRPPQPQQLQQQLQPQRPAQYPYGVPVAPVTPVQNQNRFYQ